MPREPKVKSGEPLTRAFFNRILSEFASRIVAGTGITVRRSGNQVIIGMAAGARGGGGGGFSIETVATMPAIPTEPTIVYHSVDGQMWGSGPGHTRWYPLMRGTTRSGAPGS